MVPHKRTCIAPATPSTSRIKGEHPTRTGNRKLKRAFFLAVFTALHGPTSRAHYDRKRAEGKKHNAQMGYARQSSIDFGEALSEEAWMRRDTGLMHRRSVAASQSTETTRNICRQHVHTKRALCHPYTKCHCKFSEYSTAQRVGRSTLPVRLPVERSAQAASRSPERGDPRRL